jgi:hypothetical protein
MLHYFLAPRRETPPDTSIRLGNIIEQPRFADEPLNHNLLPIKSDIMQIFGIGGDVNTTMSKGTTETWSCEKIITTSFDPTTEYIKKSLEGTDIQQYIKENRNWLLDTKLYMVTGIKVAYGASGTVSYARKKGIHLHLGVDATQMGVPLGIGPDIGADKSRNVTQTFGDMEPFVLAFRMQRIMVSSKGEVRHRNEEGGMLGVDVGEGDHPVQLVVDGLESGDADAEEFGICTSWTVGEDGGGETSTCALVEDE